LALTAVAVAIADIAVAVNAVNAAANTANAATPDVVPAVAVFFATLRTINF
jgi:hypothetical protein